MPHKCKRFLEKEPGHTNCPHCKRWSIRLGKCKEHGTIIESNKPVDDDVGWARW